MFFRVSGTLPKLDNINIEDFKNKLTSRGYQVKEGEDNKINFFKEGKIESILNEIVPITESKGWNVTEDLYLEEWNSNFNRSSIYHNGRIHRKEF